MTVAHHGKTHGPLYRLVIWVIALAVVGTVAATAAYFASRHNIAGGVTAMVGITLGSILSRLVGTAASRQSTLLLWHETIANNRLQRRLVGIFTQTEAIERAREQVTHLPGFSLAPQSFLIVPTDIDPMSRLERVRLAVENARHRNSTLALEATTLYMVWGAARGTYILLGDQGYAGVSSTQELAARLLRRALSRDPQGDYHVETIRLTSMLWPSGFSEPASGVRPLTIQS